MSKLRPNSPSIIFEAPAADDAEGLKERVKSVVVESKLLPEGETVEREVDWFFSKMGIDPIYFRDASAEAIANHIIAIYGAKVVAKAKKAEKPDLTFVNETEEGAVFFQTSQPGKSRGSSHEEVIDAKYLDNPKNYYRLETYRSVGQIASDMGSQLRCYFIRKCAFPMPNVSTRETDLNKIGSIDFLERATPGIKELYQDIMVQLKSREHRGPVIRVKEFDEGQEYRIVIAYKKRTVTNFFSALSDVYHHYHLFSTRKYVEQFSNGTSFVSVFLRSSVEDRSERYALGEAVQRVARDVSLMIAIPRSPLHSSFQEGALSLQETIYAYCAGTFASHFLNRLGSDYDALLSVLDAENPVHQAVLEKIRNRLATSVMSEAQVWKTVGKSLAFVRKAYLNFSQRFMPKNDAVTRSMLSSPLMQPPVAVAQLNELIEKEQDGDRRGVLRAFVTFNTHLLKTNFFKAGKSALSFRLDPAFLPQRVYPEAVYGLFFLVGNEFQGFHVRFSDVARGGIRMIRSRSPEAWLSNLKSLFSENYNLALTQQRKNKDIPEGGAKGTILMNHGASSLQCRVAFRKYIAALLDLLQESPEVLDRLGRQELLFFGPDEGTADFMDWASQHARNRNYPYWKALTTGKSLSLGGIPHDLYGMTTRSVHEYVIGALGKLGWDETQICKTMVGGADGDLGSNEIKISRDKIIAIVDGTGVIYDPQGIDRQELMRCVAVRKPSDYFDVSKLSARGFRVLVTENDVTLPDGTEVPSGLRFRNEFHLNPLSTAPLFVPCGGRPEAVNINNVARLLDGEGQPRFKVIVEGANLFFTEQARLELEKRGVVLFKDASANKGGVTSSSLEVLAALAMSDEQYLKGMCVADDGVVPDIRKRYVEEVQQRIQQNARSEFLCIWEEHERTKKPFTILSNELSKAILRLTEDLESSTLWMDEVVKKQVLHEALPSTLQEVVGFEKIVAAVPEQYLKSLFASYLASQFVYQCGIDTSQLAFFTFMNQKREEK